MKKTGLIFLLFSFVLLLSCKTVDSVNQETYEKIKYNKQNCLPIWADCSFTSDQVSLFLGNYSSQKGVFASGKGQSEQLARINARQNLLDFCNETYASHNISDNSNGTLYGSRIIDTVTHDDGTVYILMFVSEKDAKKSIGGN